MIVRGESTIIDYHAPFDRGFRGESTIIDYHAPFDQGFTGRVEFVEKDMCSPPNGETEWPCNQDCRSVRCFQALSPGAAILSKR